MQEPVESRIDIGEVELCVYEWPGDSDPILLLHATGFHSRCWNQVIKLLPGQHIYAVDLRFHGGSGDVGEVDWGVLVEDIRLLVQKLELRNIVGVGHSIGGHLLARTAAALPEMFKQLVLIDPVIMTPKVFEQLHQYAEQIDATDHPVSRRKNQWQDSEEMFQRFREKPPFDSWQEAALRDYCDYALHPSDESGYRQLLCDPLNEASIYLNQAGNEAVYRELPAIVTPVTLLRAPHTDKGAADFLGSPTWPELSSALPCCREVYLPELNHFIPMQDPALVAGYISSAQQDSWQHDSA
jgi:pimeloyl-ACP methyl ester carboxylesterase